MSVLISMKYRGKEIQITRKVTLRQYRALVTMHGKENVTILLN